ncbi:MAG: ABC transporter ATP-binding protein [Ignavibacteria bacterium]
MNKVNDVSTQGFPLPREYAGRLIEIKSLKKSFDTNIVLKGIDLTLDSGKIVAIMGPNGSGKTTLLKCILGLVKPDSGEIKVKGLDINSGSEYRKFIGYMPQTPRYPENLKVKELIKMLKDISSHSSNNTYDEELIQELKLENIYNKQFGTLSSGTKQRVSSSLAFLFNREIVILDEPTAGLDPVSAEMVKEKIVKEKNNGKLVIITSHITGEVEKLAERVIFLLEGNVHVDSSVDELRKSTGESDLNKAIAKIVSQ